MTVKSEAPSQTAGTIESPLLNTSSPVCWRDRWWLLDVETSGLDRQEDDIIALRLACTEHYSVIQELEILIHPRRPLSPWAEGLTGISNQALEQAVSLDATIDDLEGLDGPLLLLDRGFTIPFLQNAYLRCGREFTVPCLLLDRLAALLLGCSPRQRTRRFLEQLPSPRSLHGTPPQNFGLKDLYALALAVFDALEETCHIQNTAQLTDFHTREEPLMSTLDTLIYDPERLTCTDAEKDACLETVKKLARLWLAVRREGCLVVITLAETEKDPFYRACLMESGDVTEPENLERVFCAYLAAGNYRGGAFLNAVLIAKGLLLLSRLIKEDPGITSQVWGWRLSEELRGFFGPAYRNKVIVTIDHEAKSKRETSLIPEFDHLSQISLAQRQALLRETDMVTLVNALYGASVVAEETLLGALTAEETEKMEAAYAQYGGCPGERDVISAQEKMIQRWEAMKPSFM